MLSPYQLQEIDNDSFEFLTDSGIKYKVYFLDYSYIFSDYPAITCPVYSFNIEAIEGNPDTSPGDERVGLTVSKILNFFFNKINNVAVYVCETLDERQSARKRKFDSWFFRYGNKELLKEDCVAVVEDLEIFNSMILHKNNPELLQLILAYKELNERAPSK